MVIIMVIKHGHHGLDADCMEGVPTLKLFRMRINWILRFMTDLRIRSVRRLHRSIGFGGRL